MDNNELYHFGIPEMKWGNRRYQNEDGSLTDEGRVHYGYGAKRTGGFASKLKANHAAKVAQKKKEKAQKARLEKARKAREKAKKEKAKIPTKKQLEKILNKGSAKDLDKYKEYFTTEQKNAAYARLLAERNIKNLKRSPLQTMDNITKGIGVAANGINNMTALYNNYARVANSLWDADMKYITTETKNGVGGLSKNAARLADEYVKMMSDLSAKELVETKINFAQATSQIRYLDEIEKTTLSNDKRNKKKKTPMDDIRELLKAE